ncbi:MAG: aminotransferase DegT [Pseudoalteromonas sp.]|uniref:DegT/DnrJ/EryC1/StrS family aminotransferase n=1 Tax=Pseudoalteromonas sp. TaxID=53249 RepID=UPI000C9007A7|nr:DegT/DnrJ/EryC1/StrS family aminotransferase [Pseudoalteromonas sp.]MAD02210.1 aminotransferase DegT [Pseudoalteromonas sp.]
MNFIDLKTQYAKNKQSVDAGIQAVLDHGQYIMGPEVAESEAQLAEYTGAKHCITVASGTEALLMSLMAIGVKPGDEVITTPFTFIATVEVIVLMGAVPVFVDVEADTANIDVSQIEAKISDKTKAIMPVSLYGQPADMDEINAIAQKHDLVVIEDGAQSFGADYKGAKSCNLSHIGCTSFFPSKPLGCYGDGGAIFTNDDALAEAIREIRVHGQSARYVHTRVGVGGRMDAIQCAVIIAKLKTFDYEVERRLAIGERYNALFAGKVQTITQRDDRTSVFAQYTILVNNRDEVCAALREQVIPTAVHYPIPCNRQPAYKQYGVEGESPIADTLAEKVVSLPMHPYLSDEDMDKIVAAVLSVAK